MKFEPVRIGVVGLGDFGGLHAATLAGLAEADLVALVDRRPEAIDAARRSLAGVDHVTATTDLDDALRRSRAEAWVVATSTPSHVALAHTLLEADQWVMLEKPIASSLAEARRLGPVIAQHPGRLMLGHIVLFNSEFRALRDETVKRGPIRHIHCTRMRGVDHLALFPGETPFHLTMVHDLYAVQTLLGRPTPRRFWAQAHRNAGGAVDLALAQIEFENGALAAFAAGFMAPEGMGTLACDRTEVYGEGWSARSEPTPRPFQVWDDRARRPMAAEIRADRGGPSGMLAEELRCFCRVVRGVDEIPIGATYVDAMQVEEWLDALTRAAGIAP